MRAEIELWELLLYGAFCLAGGVLCGWIIWKADIRPRRKCGAAVFGPGVRMHPEFYCARRRLHIGAHRESRRVRKWREWRERW